MLKIINKLSIQTKQRGLSVLFASFITILGSSCNGSDYIISKEDSLIKKDGENSSGIVIVPPKVKYAAYTFVIDSNDNVYFYSLPEEPKKLSVYDDDEPEVLGILPNHLFSIPKGSENVFFEKNVLRQKSLRPMKTVMISSFKDSVRGDFIKYIRSLATDTANKISFRVRLALPEEREVIKYKLNGAYYAPKY